MATVLKTNSHLESEYLRRTPGSAKLFGEAIKVFPSGENSGRITKLPWPRRLRSSRCDTKSQIASLSLRAAPRIMPVTSRSLSGEKTTPTTELA